MKKVDNIRVRVEYVVELSGFEIPQELFDQLESLERIDMTSDALMLGFPNVLDWLSENIEEKDAFEWSYEIEEISATE